MLSIGLTGGIGSGKSLVAAVLEHMGYPVFYSDQEAKALYNEDDLLQKELCALVGSPLYVNGIFQKEVLSQALFNNPELKKEYDKWERGLCYLQETLPDLVVSNSNGSPDTLKAFKHSYCLGNIEKFNL